MKHSKGEWRLRRLEDGDDKLEGVVYAIDAPDWLELALVNVHTDAQDEGEANARLLVAAPKLLAACREFVRKCESGEARSIRSYAQMKEAIALVEEGPLP